VKNKREITSDIIGEMDSNMEIWYVINNLGIIKYNCFSYVRYLAFENIKIKKLTARIISILNLHNFQ